MKRIVCLIVLFLLVSGAAYSALADEVLYNAIVTRNYDNSTTSVYRAMDKESKVLRTYNPGQKLQVTGVYPNWIAINYNGGTGYILRHRVDEVVAVDPSKTPPYGVEVNQYYTQIKSTVYVMSEPSHESETLSTLTEGAWVSFIGIENGWAKMVYFRQYAYVDTRLLDELLPVTGDLDTTPADTPLAVFTSFYNNNANRIVNLGVACNRLNRVLVNGEKLDFNGTVGPFNAGTGYLPAPILKDGETKQGYGGGSCQISSTLHNLVLQLPGVTVVMRFPHGANGAPYLPHGTDASSGDLNFIIRNDYPFAIRIDSSTHDNALFMAIYREDYQ